MGHGESVRGQQCVGQAQQAVALVLKVKASVVYCEHVDHKLANGHSCFEKAVCEPSCRVCSH